jgi:hypothetical protein
MLTYREYVTYFVRTVRCCSTSFTFSVLSVAALKRFKNQIREYWYIGLMLARSAVANRQGMTYNRGASNGQKFE